MKNVKNMKNVDVKVTKVDAEKAKDEYKEPAFVEVKSDGVRQYWKNLSFKKKLGLILGSACAAAGAATAGYFIGRTITSKAETLTLTLPSEDVIETSVSNDEVVE